MNHLKKNYNWYYITALIDGLFGVVAHAIVLINYFLGLLLGCLLFPLSLVLVVLSVIVVYKVLRYKQPRIHLILPIVYLALSAFSVAYSFIAIFVSRNDDVLYDELFRWLIIFGFVVSVLELLFSGYMLLRNVNIRIKWPTK